MVLVREGVEGWGEGGGKGVEGRGRALLGDIRRLIHMVKVVSSGCQKH